MLVREHATGVNASDLAAKKYFTALNAEVDKQGINKLAHVLTSLNNLKTKVDGLDNGKLKTVLIDLKELKDVLNKESVKNTKSNSLKKRIDKLDKKFLIQLLRFT